MLHKCKWKLEKDNLYLTEMFQTHLLKKFLEKEEVLATWVDELHLHRATEATISSKSILRKENVYFSELRFKSAKLVLEKQKVSTVYSKGSKKSIIQGYCQEGIFTFYRDDIVLKDNKVCIKGSDVLVPYLEKDINAMLKKSNKGGIDLNIVDMRKVLKKASKVTYLCDVVSQTKYMNTDINCILDRIKVITDESSANYLVHLDMEAGFNFEVVKEFMECMYDICDDGHVLVGCNERKKKKLSNKKKDIFDEQDEVKPYLVLKVLIGVLSE